MTTTATHESYDTVAENLDRFNVEGYDVEWRRGQFVVVKGLTPVFYADYSWELSDWAEKHEREMELA